MIEGGRFMLRRSKWVTYELPPGIIGGDSFEERRVSLRESDDGVSRSYLGVISVWQVKKLIFLTYAIKSYEQECRLDLFAPHIGGIVAIRRCSAAVHGENRSLCICGMTNPGNVAQPMVINSPSYDPTPTGPKRQFPRPQPFSTRPLPSA
ncbi:hypothetical protein Tco_1035714, partial [Tanacetum coccineum]